MWPGESVAKRDKKTAAYKRRRQIWLGVAVLLILFAVAGAWKWMPLADQIDIRKITIWVHSIRDNPGGPLIILGAYLGGSLLIIPITVLILATARVFGPLTRMCLFICRLFLGRRSHLWHRLFFGAEFYPASCWIQVAAGRAEDRPGGHHGRCHNASPAGRAFYYRQLSFRGVSSQISGLYHWNSSRHGAGNRRD